MAGNLGRLPELAEQYLHAAMGLAKFFLSPSTPLNIAAVAGVALVCILLRVYIGGIIGWLIRYLVYVGLYWKLVHFPSFMAHFPPSEPISLRIGLVNVAAKLIVSINNGGYAAYIIAFYFLVAFLVPVTILGWFFRRRRRARRRDNIAPAMATSGAATAGGSGEAFNVVRREGEKKQTMVIMMTDIKGYSAKMEKDEAATFELLKEHNVIMRKAIGQNRGREIKTIGDAFMVVFNAPIDGVNCGIAMQKGLHAFNKARPANDQLLVRIGLYQGEVIVTQKDVFGEGVNIAARMESITDPGGISISKEIYDAVLGKVEAGFQSVGIPKMKNIASPPEVFKMHINHS